MRMRVWGKIYIVIMYTVDIGMMNTIDMTIACMVILYIVIVDIIIMNRVRSNRIRVNIVNVNMFIVGTVMSYVGMLYNVTSHMFSFTIVITDIGRVISVMIDSVSVNNDIMYIVRADMSSMCTVILDMVMVDMVRVGMCMIYTDHVESVSGVIVICGIVSWNIVSVDMINADMVMMDMVSVDTVIVDIIMVYAC